MTSVARSQPIGQSNPLLDFYTVNDAGVLAAPAQLQFQIFDLSTGAEVQVFPVTPGNKQTVNLVNDKVGTGHFAAAWTPGGAEPIAKHRIRWFWTQVATERVIDRDFEVLDAIIDTKQQGYVTVASLRDEGITSTFADNVRAYTLILRASRMVERYTGRLFGPRQLSIKMDGKGGKSILFDEPIIAVEKVTFETSEFLPSTFDLESDALRVYNRHLSQNLRQPDDRNNPRIDIYHSSYDLTDAQSPYAFTRLVFPRGQQNILVDGVFGYTDYDGTPTGRMPDLIEHVTRLLIVRELRKLGSFGQRDDAIKRGRLIGERTRDQAYTLEGLGSLRGSLTGDPEIDTILISYLRPPMVGAA